MSDDSFSEVTSESWFGRLGSAVKGLLIGGVMFLASFFVLFWNEGRAVTTAKSLEEGAAAVVSVSADKVDAANDNKLVHVTAPATTDETLTDSLFGISAQVIKLRRLVEMYQWDEKKESKTKEKLGGGTETVTTYSYSKTWSDDVIDSNDFHVNGRSKHVNPGSMPFERAEDVADTVMVGVYQLSSGLLSQYDDYKTRDITEKDLENVDADIRDQIKVHERAFYKGADPAKPEIGDVRVRFQVVEPGTVSVVAKQVGSTFGPYDTKAGDSLERLEVGTHTADAMFQAMMRENEIMTWILRAVGFVVMFIGLNMLVRPFVVFASVVPFLGDLLGMGLGIFCFLIAAALSLGTIAIGWIAYRPVLGILLLVASVGLVVLLKVVAGGRKAAAADAAAA